MKLEKVILLVFCLFCGMVSLNAEEKVRGYVIDEESSEAIRYVSVGIPYKNIGTVTNQDGNFCIGIEDEFEKDSLKFSYVGYEAKSICLNDLTKNDLNCIKLKRANILLKEVVVLPQSSLKEIVLGNNPKGKLRAGFKENNKGFECGVLLEISEASILKELNCNIAECTYDSIHFRVNIYEEVTKNTFESVLIYPIEIKQIVEKNQKRLSISLLEHDIKVSTNTLITLEYIEDLGDGRLLFNAGLLKGATTYLRKTSQGSWQKSKIKLGFSAIVLAGVK